MLLANNAAKAEFLKTIDWLNLPEAHRALFLRGTLEGYMVHTPNTSLPEAQLGCMEKRGVKSMYQINADVTAFLALRPDLQEQPLAVSLQAYLMKDCPTPR
jgi:hypothetical protein